MQRKHNPDLTLNAKKLRKEMTREERHLWYDFLRGYPFRFLRQKVIDNYIVDFYCHQARLIIELDGSQHYTEMGIARDDFRTYRIANRDLLVLRIDNRSVMQNFAGVCNHIDKVVKERIRLNPPVTCGDSPL